MFNIQQTHDFYTFSIQFFDLSVLLLESLNSNIGWKWNDIYYVWEFL